MQLNVNGDICGENPENDQLRSAIANLGEEEFLILSGEEEYYIQTYHNEDGTYQLEYRDGSEDRHFCVDPQSITVDDVKEAIVMYSNDPSSIAEKWNWEKLDL